MRSLSSVIHSGQYGPVVSDYRPQETESNDQPREDERGQEQTKSIIEQAFLKAKQIVDSAQEYAAEAIRKARETIAEESTEAKSHGYADGYAKGSEKGRKEGSDAGYRAGFEEGRKQAEADNRKTLDELGLMIESVEKSKTDILSEFENDLIDLATTMAQRILKQELHSDDRALRKIILSAMEEYRNQEWIRIYVPEETANVLLKADNRIADDLKGISDSVKVIASKEMDDGSCVIETPDQIIDAGVDSQLAKLREAVSEASRRQPGSTT